MENKNIILEDIVVAGLVLNEKKEFLVLKENDGLFTFPSVGVKAMPGNVWEILERNLAEYLQTKLGLDLEPGMIPFTDQEFIGREGFEQIIMFYVCRTKDTSSELQNISWQKFSQMDAKKFKPLIYQVYQKAQNFIDNLEQISI